MNTMLYVVSLAFFLLVGQHQLNALSTGAPICSIDGPAPQNIHLQRGANITGTGSLASAGFNVTFNGVDLSSLSSIQVNASSPIKVEVRSSGVPLKGVLVIVSKASTDFTDVFTLSTEEATLIQKSEFCPALARGGVTHVSPDEKNKVSATMTFDKAYTDVKLDVNVVTQNNDTGSYYYYSQYIFAVNAAPAGSPSGSGSGSDCGLFGLGIFCPFTFCGFFGRLLLGDRDC